MAAYSLKNEHQNFNPTQDDTKRTRLRVDSVNLIAWKNRFHFSTNTSANKKRQTVNGENGEQKIDGCVLENQAQGFYRSRCLSLELNIILCFNRSSKHVQTNWK